MIQHGLHSCANGPCAQHGLMRMLFASEAPGQMSLIGPGPSKKANWLRMKVIGFSRGLNLARKNFLDFSDFTAEIQDTESEIDLNQLSQDLGAASTVQDSVIAQRLLLMSGNDQWFLEHLDRWERWKHIGLGGY